MDRNNIQIDGYTEDIMPLEGLRAKYEAFNWHVLEMDGNNIDAVIAGLHNARSFVGKGKPIVILMSTVMGYGVDFMAGNYEWHGVAPNDEQLAKALAQLPRTMADY